MNIAGSPRLLAGLLLASLALNLWQLLRPLPPADDAARKSVASAISPNRLAPGPLLANQADVEPEEEDASSVETISPEQPPEQQSEDELIFGDSGNVWDPPIRGDIRGEPSGKVSLQRLKDLANMPASQAERFRLHVRLLLPGDRTLDLGNSEFAAGQRIKLDRLKEFPFPSSFTLAQVSDSQPGKEASFVSPTKPAEFEFKNQGLEIELDVTPAPGVLVLGGKFTQTAFEGLGPMPGEAFSPIIDDKDTVLTDNMVLQPQLTTRESPFVAAATAGQTCQIPVLMSFGQTLLELTCTPVE